MRYDRQPSILEEVRQIRSFFKIPKQERGIVFYSERSEYWRAFEGLIAELRDGHDQRVCYITSDWRDPVLAGGHANIHALYIRTLLPFFMQSIDSPVMVMTLTDLGNHAIKRSRHLVHYVYVFHALVSTHMVYAFGAFDNYDSIVCVGPQHVREIRKQEELYGLKKKELIEAGYYRLEQIMASWREQMPARVFRRKRKTVLVAPSWGDQNILETCGEELTVVLLNADYNVIVRPHSETLKRCPDLIQKIEDKFTSHERFTLEKSNAGDRSILSADMLISDCSGITLEYAFGTERPVIFIDVPLKIKNHRYQELGIEPLELTLRKQIGAIVPPDRLDMLPQVVRRMIAEGEQYKDRIIAARSRSVFNIGSSSKAGAAHLVRLVRGNPKVDFPLT